MNLLRQTGHKTHVLSLQQLAQETSVDDGLFDKAKAMIEKMIARLMEEQKDDCQLLMKLVIENNVKIAMHDLGFEPKKEETQKMTLDATEDDLAKNMKHDLITELIDRLSAEFAAEATFRRIGP